MKKEMTKIQVVETEDHQVLFECAVHESEKAYSFAAEMDNMGISVKVISPTLSQTLSDSLGLSREELARYEASMEEEMEHHEGSCCFKDTPTETKH